MVVKPDIDSKKASTGLSIAEDKRKGSIPKRALVIHPKVTMAKPSLTLISDPPRVVTQRRKPDPMVIPAERRIAIVSPSP